MVELVAVGPENKLAYLYQSRIYSPELKEGVINYRLASYTLAQISRMTEGICVVYVEDGWTCYIYENNKLIRFDARNDYLATDEFKSFDYLPGLILSDGIPIFGQVNNEFIQAVMKEC